MTFAEQFEVYKQNVFPAMLEILSKDLGITIESIQELGVGFYPAKQVWVFAERDAKGEIIGLVYRGLDGKKFMANGSKRGLIYSYNENYIEGEGRYEAGKYHWVQIHRTKRACPICGLRDWCRLSSDYEDPQGPSAVACNRIQKGSIQELHPDGYLHILDERRQKMAGSSVLRETTLPIPIVEGSSDVLAAMDLGFVAIGRPSAKGGMELLKKMPLTGEEIWIIGENDAGIGKEGMEKTFLNLKNFSDRVFHIMPPKKIKDLRQWVNKGLIQEGLIAYVKEHGESELINPNIFNDDIAQNIAKEFLRQCFTEEDRLTLRSYHGKWAVWRNGKYDILEPDAFRGMFYKFLDGKHHIKVSSKGVETVPYKPTRSKINDIMDALTSRCPIFGVPPLWIGDRNENQQNIQ